jgi:hypothetical protein
MAAQQNMLEGIWWIKCNRMIQNCAYIWFSFLKWILMRDEKFKKRVGKLAYVHSVKLSINAGDLAVRPNRTSPGSTVSRTRKARK